MKQKGKRLVGEDQIKLKDKRLIEIAEGLFKSRSDVDTLQNYLEEITGDKVTMANFTQRQTQGMIRLMLMDKLFLEPLKVPNSENVLKNFSTIIVETSKGKEAYGLEAMKDILRAKRELEEKTRLGEKGAPEGMETKKEMSPNA